MTYTDWRAALNVELGRQLGVSAQEANSETEGTEEMFEDGLSPSDAASELLSCMADCIGEP